MPDVEKPAAVMPDAQPGAAAPIASAAAQADRAVVLLVDDQPMVGEAIRRMLLDQPDIDYHYCPNGKLAVETAERLAPTVILQDLVMPDVDGLTLVGRYRASPVIGDTPVIVLSSKEDPAIKRDAFQGGANDYLVKLPDAIELIARIRLHSKAFVTQIQRDAAYRSLTESQRQLVVSNSQLEERIQELQAVRDELSRLVSTDSMTGLYSRRRWFELAATEFSRHVRYKRPVTLLMADLDQFKRINDTYGHDIGDQVIRRFATVLRTVCRESDLPGRIGGEEFAVMLPETSMSGAEEAARRVVVACREATVPIPTGHVTFTCSLGVAEAIDADTSVDDMLRRGDAALYEAKRGGRDGWRSA
jgi:two-component system chemotaxis family response regulator WspR